MFHDPHFRDTKGLTRRCSEPLRVTPVRIIVAIAVIAASTGCSRRVVDDAEHADYRVRAIEEFERLTSSKDYVYLHYIAAESGKRAAGLRSGLGSLRSGLRPGGSLPGLRCHLLRSSQLE